MNEHRQCCSCGQGEMARPRRVEESKRTAVRRKKMNPAARPNKLCQWSDEQMKWAMEAVMNGELGVNRSALLHGVPKTTLKDRIAGRIKHGTKPEPVAYLNAKEEEELVNFLFGCSTMGYGKTKREVLQIVGKEKRNCVESAHRGWLVVPPLTEVAEVVTTKGRRLFPSAS